MFAVLCWQHVTFCADVMIMLLAHPVDTHAGTQSLYRESEAQTLPWSPDWVQPTNAAVLAKQAALCAKYNIAGPEVLQLAHLTFGNGLPCGCNPVLGPLRPYTCVTGLTGCKMRQRQMWLVRLHAVRC